MNCNSETEEETIAVNKKRARRVSFAENTSVHIFDRDEESESPTDPVATSTDVNPTELGLFNDELGFRRHLIDPKDILRNEDEEEEEDDDDDDDDMDARPSFFRPMESPSSGSGFGSATSNDEDNFFGPPVSASFIRPGRLSDSAPYDDNHEVTMDSTAFSMNFRSLAKSDSGGDLLTSTGVHLTFDEKTPTQDCIPSNVDSTMVLTVAKRPNLQSSPPTAKLKSNSDSNDMSLVGEISRRYDYGGLSPGLDKLLAQTSKDLHASDENGYLESLKNIKSGISPTKEHGFSHSIVDGDECKEMVRNTTHDGNSRTDVVSIEQNISTIDCGTLFNLETKHHKLGGSGLQVWNSPLISSINSLSPKQSQIVDDSLHLSKSPWHTTPNLKQASYFVGSDDRIHKASASSIQKSISKLELLQASPFSVALSAKISSSNFRPSHYLPRTPLGSALKSKATYVKDADGDRIESVIQEKGDQKQDKKIETPKDIKCIVPAKALRSALKSGRSPYNVSAANPYAHQQKKESGLVTLLPQSFCPPQQSEHNILSSDDPSEVKLVTFGTDASIITLECMEGKGEIGTPHNLTSPVRRKIEGTSSTLSNNLGTRPQEKSDLRGDAANACFLAATVDNKDPLSRYGMVESCSPIVHNNRSRGSPVAKNLNGDIYHSDNNQGNCGTNKKSPIPLERRVSHIFQCRTPNRDSETEREQTNARNDLVEEGEEVAFCSSNVSFSQKSANDPSIRKNLGKLFAQSPSGNEEQNVIHSDSIYPISVLGKLSPSSNQVTTIVENSTRKRSNEEITPQDGSTKAQKSPKLFIGGCDPDVLKSLNGDVSRGSTGGDVLKHWVDIQSKTSEVMKNLLSLPADELSLQSIDALENIVVGLLRKQKYQMLCADMQSQKTNHPLNNHQNRRVAEAKLLLHKLVEEKAELQLKRVKRDILLKKAQIMRSRVQECQMLRSDHSILHPQKALNVQADIHCQHFSDRQLQSSQDNVTALRQVLEDLERNVIKFTESFLVRCKIKGKPDSAETVVLVDDYLTKRACCRFLRLDMQMWDIIHLENRNGRCNILLNYLGFITQRLTVVFHPVSIISVSNELHNINIVKNLPGVDARTAFACVFDAEPTRKYVSSRSLAEETQISSLLLGSMLDVVEEVQLARLELRNLVQCTFCSESVEQLDLQLNFLNLKSGKRAIFTFDLSCLKRGVYPSEIIPSIMEAPADVEQKYCSKQFLTEVRNAVQSLRVGYLRIIRACRCISQAIEASNS